MNMVRLRPYNTYFISVFEFFFRLSWYNKRITNPICTSVPTMIQEFNFRIRITRHIAES